MGSAPASSTDCNRCGKPATLQCPKCLEQGLPKVGSVFCSQDCFKQSWAEHKKAHPKKADDWAFCTKRGRGRSKTMPAGNYMGELRPYKIGPTRQARTPLPLQYKTIPAGISKPDWAKNGEPTTEINSRHQNSVPIFEEKLAGIREAALLGRRVLDKAHAAVQPGITTDEIDRVVHEATVAAGAYPSPLNYWNFPKSVCTSVNEIICHGIPDQRPLQSGDIVNVDVSVFYKGYHGDLNETYIVGEANEDSKKLLKVAHECLMAAIAIVKPGVRYREVGAVISNHAEKHGLGVVKTYCGHGIGECFHCAPNIPHYRGNKAVGVMKEGQVFTIEPMINQGTWRDVTWPDGWASSTADGKRSAQFEHTLVVTKNGCDILTARIPGESPPLFWEDGYTGNPSAADGATGAAAGSDAGAAAGSAAQAAATSAATVAAAAAAGAPSSQPANGRTL